MTKRFGSLVGTPKNAAVYQQVDMAYEHAIDEVIVRDTFTAAAAPIADTISVAQNLGWETILDLGACKIWFAALGAASTLSFGDVTYPAGLDAAFDTHTAASATTGVQLGSAITIGNLWQPLWQMLGYPSLAAAQAVGQQCELLFTVAGGAITGIVSWQLKGQPRT